jgi:hypothetical protein
MHWKGNSEMPKTKAQLDRDIAEALARGPGSGPQPLYGHTSQATAYLVEDYPYGFSARTQIRYWLEYKPKKGWRFVSQTLNPKTGRWNKPKASTYAELAAAMYLDAQGHVTWRGVTPYSDERQVLSFVQDFPGADMRALRQYVSAKIKFLEDMLSGRRYFTVNGVRQVPSEAEQAERQRDLATWEEIGALLR